VSWADNENPIACEKSVPTGKEFIPELLQFCWEGHFFFDKLAEHFDFANTVSAI